MYQEDAAFLLFARPQGETSLWLSVLTAQHGRLGLVRKGGRRQMASCPSFQPLLLRWRRGFVDACETRGYAPVLSGMANWCGLYLNELVHRAAMPELPLPAVFSAYADALTGLRLAGEDRHWLGDVLRRFEWHLLSQLGYGLEDSQSWQADLNYVWRGQSWQVQAQGVPGHSLCLVAQQGVVEKPLGLSPALRPLLQQQLMRVVPGEELAMRAWWQRF